MSKTILSMWFDPRYAQMVVEKQVFNLGLRVDSLQQENTKKESFIYDLKKMILGPTFEPSSSATVESHPTTIPTSNMNMEISAVDSSFRKEFEDNAQMEWKTVENTFPVNEVHFFSPTTGLISAKFDITINHLGVDIVTNPGEPVKSIADGIIIMSSWTQDAGYVIAIQHHGNLVSIYKHNAQLFKKVGNFVNAGDIISIVGNTGDLTDGPHLHFELWYDCSPLDPMDFIIF